MLNYQFIHLRTQSSYSLLESAIKIDAIIARTKKLKMPAIALTDRNNLFGMLEFSMEATKSRIQPIHGALVTLKSHQELGEILLIAKNNIGYKNLLKLVSHIYTKPERENNLEISFDDLKNYQDGLIVLSGYINGHIGKALLSEDYALAKKYAEEFKELLGDRFYMEIMRHGLEKEKTIEAAYINLAIECSIPLVATNNIFFENIELHDAHDVLLCIAEGVVKEQTDRNRVSNQCYFKSGAEMTELFSDLPEAIENTYYIMQRCVAIAEPSPPCLPNFTSGDISEEALLRKEAHEGLEKRLEQKFILENIEEKEQKLIRDTYLKRIDYELEIICKMNFSGYFLIVSDFIKWSKNNGIPVGPGRGSGAGSVVAWSLLITDPDPIKFGLLFERFLNPERISMPDFDIDFCQEGRDEVIKYVRSKYGDSKVGQIITFGKMQAKAVIKDVSRVLGLRYEYADYLTELVPFNAVTPVTLGQAINEVSELGQAARGGGLYNLKGEEELIKQVLDTALILEGVHRHVSVHAAGIVIGATDLVEILPIYKDPSSDMLIIQYSMKYAEAAGLVKFDFLGLQTLTVIDKCVQLIEKQGITIDLANLPFTDEKSYELLTRGESSGVFQFESVGVRDSLRKLKPDCIEDIIAIGALYRPGPMDNIPAYISCKHGRQAPDYLHPKLEETLKETYGVIIYQEQVLEIARVLAGYTLGAADLLRRAMGKKIKAEMDAQEVMFIEGAKKNGVSVDQAANIFASVAKFAGYGFNKAHATAYGIISYQTAYLKANYPAEFLTTCMNLDMGDSDKINLFIQESNNFGIEIIPPDVNRSYGSFMIGHRASSSSSTTEPMTRNDKIDSQVKPENDGKYIYFALGAIKNVTVNLGDIIAEERSKKPFASMMDFMERIPTKALNRRGLENLIKAGAFDSLHSNRNELLLSIPKLLSHANSHHHETLMQQFSLLGADVAYILEKAEDLSDEEKSIMEFEVCGVFLRNHPITQYNKLLEAKNVKNSYQLKHEIKPGSHKIDIAGIIQKKDARMSARGRFITVGLSDSYGNFEVTIFNESVMKEYSELLELQKMVVVTCDLFKDEGGGRLTAIKFCDIEQYLSKDMHEMTIYLNSMEELDQLTKTLLEKKSDTAGSKTQLTVFVPSNGNMVAKISLPPMMLMLQDVAELKQYETA